MIERTLQTRTPSNWKIKIPFSSQGRRISHEDIVEGNPTHRNPTAIPIIDYDPTTSEDDDDELLNDDDDLLDDDDKLLNNDDEDDDRNYEEFLDTHRDF